MAPQLDAHSTGGHHALRLHQPLQLVDAEPLVPGRIADGDECRTYRLLPLGLGKQRIDVLQPPLRPVHALVDFPLDPDLGLDVVCDAAVFVL